MMTFHSLLSLCAGSLPSFLPQTKMSPSASERCKNGLYHKVAQMNSRPKRSCGHHKGVSFAELRSQSSVGLALSNSLSSRFGKKSTLLSQRFASLQSAKSRWGHLVKFRSVDSVVLKKRTASTNAEVDSISDHWILPGVEAEVQKVLFHAEHDSRMSAIPRHRTCRPKKSCFLSRRSLWVRFRFHLSSLVTQSLNRKRLFCLITVFRGHSHSN